MDFVRSHFGINATLTSWTIFFSQKIPAAVLTKYTGTLCEEQSVQLVRVVFLRSDFLQKPYFKNVINTKLSVSAFE